MMSLSNLKNSHRKVKKIRRVGRGPGSGDGKTSGRGHKGDGSRSGYRRRYGYEGGQLPLYLKLPTRGFSNAQFRKEYNTINLRQIEKLFNDGEVVNEKTLQERGFFSGKLSGLKVLGDGKLTKKVTIEADAYSESAREKLQKAGIAFKNLKEDKNSK